MHPDTYEALMERRNQEKAEGRLFMANAWGCKDTEGNDCTLETFLPRREEVTHGRAEVLADKVKRAHAAMTAGR
jgi:hypothetical protein